MSTVEWSCRGRRSRRAVFVGALLLCTAALAWAAPSGKWRLQVSGHARAAGQVELSFTPEGGAATGVVIDIPQGLGENAAARLLRDRIRGHFGKEVYDVEVDDGEDVLVKVRHGIPDVDLVVVRNTATGLRIVPDRE